MLTMTKAASTLLIVFLIICTLPLWVGIAGGIFGLIAGLFGAIIGLIAGIFGGIAAGIGAIFHALFGWGWHGHWFHFNGLGILAFIIIVALIISKGKKR